VVKLVETGSS